MRTLLAGLVRWFSGKLISFLVIVAVLVVGGFAHQEIQEFKSTMSALPILKKADVDLAEYARNKTIDSLALVASLQKDSADALGRRIDVLDKQIKEKKAARRPNTARALSLFKGDNLIFDDLKGDVDTALLEQEHQYLKQLHAAVIDAAKRATLVEELELLRQEVAATFDAVKSHDADHASLINKSMKMLGLDFKRTSLVKANHQAFDAYEKKQQYIAAHISTAKVLGPFEINLDQIGQELRREIESQKEKLEHNWVMIVSEPVVSVIPTAFGILLAIIFVPIGIKAVFYFVIAPIASRRAAICLMPDVSGTIGAGPDVASGAIQREKVSAVSVSIAVDENHELLVHQEYLQSSSLLGKKDTKWLLNWSYPLSSVLADMFALTRIRASASESFVISATKDPFSEIAVISIPEGAAVVFQPHCLVGLVQRQQHPIRITRHWRLGTLQAWLTLQLRYLVFHGPASLIVKGCRGVRIESANAGRSINQAATIGFSANLAYSTTRCETFASYLMGKQELFNDNFAGGPGHYIYEETPHFGKKAGITGRGLEGLTDTVLKVFGI